MPWVTHSVSAWFPCVQQLTIIEWFLLGVVKGIVGEAMLELGWPEWVKNRVRDGREQIVDDVQRRIASFVQKESDGAIIRCVFVGDRMS